MTKSLDEVKEVESFVPENARPISLRENNYEVLKTNYDDSKGSKYEVKENLEIYSCDAGCKNCHCATY
jgi:hypothetical protein